MDLVITSERYGHSQHLNLVSPLGTRLMLILKESPKNRDMFDAVYQTAMEFNIDGSRVSMSSSTIYSTWYTKSVTDSSRCLSSNNINIMRSKIENGSAISYRDAPLILADDQSISGDHITSVGQRFPKVSKYPKYTSTPYWYFTRYYTTEKVSVLRWAVGLGTKISAISKSRRYIWCTDDCWVRTLTGDSYGKQLFGSTTQLAQALRSGHQLRVNIPGIAAPTKAVYIHGNTITACLKDIIEPVGVANYDQSGTAQRKMVSTNGQVQTRRYTCETDTIIDDLQEQHPINRFVDTREWIQLLSVSGGGQILSGTVRDLRERVLLGASVRVVVDHTDGVCLTVDADHLEISPDGHVAADVIYHANIQFGENDNITFTHASSYHLWSAVITTEGDFRKYLYTYKIHGGQHQTISSNDIVKY